MPELTKTARPHHGITTKVLYLRGLYYITWVYHQDGRRVDCPPSPLPPD